MISESITYGTITVNDGPAVDGKLTVEQSYETVESLYGGKPDLTWELVDAAGHFHAYDADGELPTLVGRTRHIGCDGSCDLDESGDDIGGCEGYTVVDWHCRICDQLVEPGSVPDRGPHQIPTRRSWHVEVATVEPMQGQVTVRIAGRDGAVLFGVADATTASLVFNDGRTTINTVLRGVGPLGQRRAQRILA